MRSRLIFRFAEEGEGKEIANIVNLAYCFNSADSSQYEKDGGRCMSNDSNVSQDIYTTTDQVEKILEKDGTQKWYVAEESNGTMVGVCSFERLETSTSTICLFAIHPSYQNQGIGTRLLNAIETINFAQSNNHMIQTHIPFWRETAFSWCLHRGYAENGGGLWEYNNGTPPTRYVTLRKAMGENMNRHEDITPSLIQDLKSLSCNDPGPNPWIQPEFKVNEIKSQSFQNPEVSDMDEGEESNKTVTWKKKLVEEDPHDHQELENLMRLLTCQLHQLKHS